MRSPVPLVARGTRSWWAQQGRSRGDFVNQMDQYGSDGVVFPIVNRLMYAVAKPDWKLYTKAANREDRTEVTSHAVLDFLAKPNPVLSWKQIMMAGQQHNDLTGETNIVLGFSPGVKYPLDCYPVRPDRLAPVPDPWTFLAGWIYQIDGEKVPLENRELLRWIQPSPLDPYRGMGPLQSLLLDLDSQRYGKEWQASFFANSARPGGIIEVDKRLGDDEFDEMRDRWREQHQGISKAHRVAIIENGAKWIETSYSLRDLQMAELDVVSRDKALVAFGYPKAMLGIVEDVNRANAEAGEYMFGKWLVEPRLDQWKAMLNRGLLPLFGDGVEKKLELDYESPVPENNEQAMQELETKSAAVVALVGAGFDATDVLDMLEWPDLGYEKPAPPPPPVVPGADPEDPDAPPPAPAKKAVPAPPAKKAPPPENMDAAMRWVVEAHQDDSTCDKCSSNDGKTYRNRADAYADYPDGKGYIKCVGAEFGNQCRCVVKKRRRSS